ncbi:MAG: hypothetical protein AAF488_16320 [Planctomycetota bacterium]
MDTVTYPNDEVSAFISERFEPLKIDMLAKHPDFRDACAGQKVIWAPALIFADAKGRELRRYIGWLPPESFLLDLRFVLATWQFQQIDFAGARDEYRAVFDAATDGPLAAEALYWVGIAGFLAGKRDMGALREAWEKLVRDYPDTRWATHALVIEDAPQS